MSGITYHGLADGTHTFAVEATDAAGNPQASPTEFTWTVDNSQLDTEPPETAIDSAPSDPSTSPTASFTYSANEPKSTFQCSLDGAPFSVCPEGGVTYSGLGNGPHSFQVKAIDASANADPTPAGYSFAVVLAPVSLPLLPAPSPRAPAPARPQTTISSKPAARTHDRTPTFRFRSSTPGSSFQCKLDQSPYRPCRSPLTTKVLAPGAHAIAIRAVVSGAADATPAKFNFKVVVD